MNKSAFTFLTLILFGTAWMAMKANQSAADSKSDKLLRHVVRFKFKDGLGDDKVEEIEPSSLPLPV